MGDRFVFDVAVIGGGPAGMMAAGRAAELGAKVVLLEKNARLGVKLLMTGNGRCNLTNAGLTVRNLAEAYGKNGKFLTQAFSAFGASDVMRFFEGRGVRTKVEEGGRVFPASDRASDVLRALAGYMRAGGVTVMTDTPVVAVEGGAGEVGCLRMRGGKVFADSYALCVGGKSYPATGSTGDGFRWAESLGHKIVRPRPLLAPVIVNERWVGQAEGASLRDVEVGLYHAGRKRLSVSGEVVFTRNGLSGPAALNLSRAISPLLDKGGVRLMLDLAPGLDFRALDGALLDALSGAPNAFVKNLMRKFLPPRLVPVFLTLAGIAPDAAAGGVTREGRRGLARLVKGLTMTVGGLAGFERAMVTGGGVSLGEVDPRTMRSRLRANLFFAGELLDIDGPTGGYNLQVCWSTGRLAGECATRPRPRP